MFPYLLSNICVCLFIYLFCRWLNDATGWRRMTKCKFLPWCAKKPFFIVHLQPRPETFYFGIFHQPQVFCSFSARFTTLLRSNSCLHHESFIRRNAILCPKLFSNHHPVMHVECIRLLNMLELLSNPDSSDCAIP